MTNTEMKIHIRLAEAKIKRQADHLAMIRNRALNAIDGGEKSGAAKWRVELTEIARLAAKGIAL